MSFPELNKLMLIFIFLVLQNSSLGITFTVTKLLDQKILPYCLPNTFPQGQKEASGYK